MDIGIRIQDAINDQINAELYSAYIYLSMAAYCESINLPGFANWMRVQHQEETAHAMKFFDFINDRNGRVVLKPIAQPPVEFVSPLDIMEKTLEHERYVTSLLSRLYELSVEESDYPAQILLQWYLQEQVEEEKSSDDLVQQLKRIGSDGTGLLMLDAKLAQRTAAE